ncbi:MAG: prephenate dehydrogenase [Planctomyces sp.]|jgi:prephenate dehydrogenase
MTPGTESFEETHICIWGVGLIGGSIAAAVRKRMPSCRISGIGRNSDRLKQAQSLGLIDSWSTSADQTCHSDGTLTIVCLPVGQIAEAVIQLSEINSSNAVITDAGSVKSSIYTQLQRRGVSAKHFVGAHPIAGGEQTGFESAKADLFSGRVCVVTPETSLVSDISRVTEFWKTLGSHVISMSAEEHDRILACTSHLPHILASAAAGAVTIDMLRFAGSGFRDTTRIAEGSADIWADILTCNKDHVLRALKSARSYLDQLSSAISEEQIPKLKILLNDSAAVRKSLRLSDEASLRDQ